MDMETMEEYLINNLKMCSSGAMYIDEESYLRQKKKEDFYNKVDAEWDYYSGLPSPKAYEE